MKWLLSEASLTGVLQFGTGHRLSEVVLRLKSFNMARALEVPKGPLSSAASHTLGQLLSVLAATVL